MISFTFNYYKIVLISLKTRMYFGHTFLPGRDRRSVVILQAPFANPKVKHCVYIQQFIYINATR